MSGGLPNAKQAQLPSKRKRESEELLLKNPNKKQFQEDKEPKGIKYKEKEERLSSDESQKTHEDFDERLDNQLVDIAKLAQTSEEILFARELIKKYQFANQLGKAL